MLERGSAGILRLRPSQWLSFVGAHAICNLRSFFPWVKQWMWYGFRRALMAYVVKYAIDVFWLFFKKRRLGVTYFRELTMMHWVPPSMYFDKDTKMKVFLRRCGYHDCSDVGTGTTVDEGKKAEPWFYGDIDQMKGDTNQVLDRMEAKAMRKALINRTVQAEELQAVARVLKNFKEFKAEQIMEFFKASDLMKMEKGDVIFSAEDKEEYFYSVVSGEIHLFTDGIGTRGVELLKVVGPEECIVSLLAFLQNFVVGPQTYGDLMLFATCEVSGFYYRVPIAKLIAYTRTSREVIYEVLSTVLLRHQTFCIGLNDLTGILPRLHKQSYLDANYEPIEAEPGVLTGTPLGDEAFEHMESFFHLDPADRKFCWVGILDSRTVLLRRFKKTHYAFFIHKGLLACTMSKLRRSYNSIQFYLREGQIVGWREAIIGVDMAVQYQVADNSKALIIALPDFLIRRYFEIYPEMSAKLIAKLLDRDSILMRQISYTLRFTHCRANEAVYGRGDLGETGMPSETFAYLCVSGRLRFILQTSIFQGRSTFSNDRRYGIIEKGDWFGMNAMYHDDAQLHRTVFCDRYCEYVIVPRYLICVITNTFREAAGYQCDYVARQLHRDHEETFLDTDKMSDTMFQVDHFGVHTSRTYRLVCVYPISPDLPAKIYCDELARHHTSSAVVITREAALEAMKLNEVTLDNEYMLARWLISKEDEVTVLFILADTEFGDLWNETIAKICDMIHVLVTYSLPHKPAELENHILMLARKARKELVFLHPVIRVTKPQVGPSKFPHLPQGSLLWLKPRKSWIQRHHHVRLLDSAFKYAKENNPEDLETYWRDSKDPDKHSDFARVMRWISGQSVGIVLGGGGAKGAAHLGTLHYLRELDIPVDYIAGVSIGSFLGALYAVYENIEVVEAKAKELWENFKNPYRFARDVTYNPFSAVFRGHSFNWMINYFFGSIQIEDLYIPYFCVTTDLDENCSRMHMNGDLWFYVRASMTLTMLFPPQINQIDYHLLMDGGYSDLVPAMTMRKLGIKYLVAINIGDERLMQTFNIGYHVNGFKCLLQALMPHLIEKIPHHFDFWDAILFCSARNFIQILKAMDEYVIYIRPNISAFTAIDFQYYDEIKRLGYLSTKFKFGGLRLKNLPVHVIWYLLRFYTYPYVAQSQAQILQGFTDEDWEFAVNVMKKTQMCQRARTTFLKMNLTPYLTDLMEARSYLEMYINDADEMANINLNVPVLENFFRDDEKLDLVHALAKMKESNYMEDFESIVNRKAMNKEDFKIHTKIQTVASQTYDLANARSKPTRRITFADTWGRKFHEDYIGDTRELDLVFGAVRETYSIRDLYLADPTLFQAVASYRHLQNKNAVNFDVRQRGYGPSVSRVSSENREQRSRKKRSTFSRILGKLSESVSISRGKRAKSAAPSVGRRAEKGQRLEEFRKYLTKADRRKGDGDKMMPILTLKELRRSFGTDGRADLPPALK